MSEVKSSCRRCPPGSERCQNTTAANVTSNLDIHISHVIFDLDGTILDTETVNDKVYRSIAEKYGKEYTTDVSIRRRGTSGENTARLICETLGLPISWEEFIQESEIQMQSEITHCNFMPGVERLIRHLSDHKIPIAIATSSTQQGVDQKLSPYPEIKALFHHILAGGTDPEVKKPKPAPDIFLVAASRFDEKPPSCKVLVFEDAISGVEAARAAGMPVVGVPDPIVPPEMLSEATVVLKSLQDFQPEMFGLPPF